MLFPNKIARTLQLLIGSLVIADRGARSVEFHVPCHFSGQHGMLFPNKFATKLLLEEGVDPKETDGN